MSRTSHLLSQTNHRRISPTKFRSGSIVLLLLLAASWACLVLCFAYITLSGNWTRNIPEKRQGEIFKNLQERDWQASLSRLSSYQFRGSGVVISGIPVSGSQDEKAGGMASNASQQVELPLRNLGSLKSPAILTGLWQLAGGHGRINRARAVAEMEAYINEGLSAFDMADIYGPAEEIYGAFLRGFKGSAQPLGFTKYVPRPGPMPRETVERAINRSRQRMGVECLDLLQFHWWDYGNPAYIDALHALTALRREGKIREIGLTNFDTKHMRIVKEAGIPIVTNQVSYSLVDRRPEKLMLPWCLQNNVQLLAYGTLLGGFLSERYLGKPEPQRQDLTTSSLTKYKQFIDSWGNWALFQELLATLDSVAKKHNVAIANVVVRYVVDKPGVGGVIIGARMSIASHVQENLATFSFPGLDKDDTAKILAVVEKGRDLAGDCGDEYRY